MAVSSGPTVPDRDAGALPDPPPPVGAAAAGHVPRAGELTPGWLIVYTLGWVGVVVGLAAVWNASRQLGLSTWWLGPRAQARPILVTMLPFMAPAAVLVAAINRSRLLPQLGVAAAAVTAAIGVGDLGRVRRLGVVELAIAGAGAAISVAAAAGRYRTGAGDRADPADPADPAEPPRPAAPAGPQ